MTTTPSFTFAAITLCLGVLLPGNANAWSHWTGLSPDAAADRIYEYCSFSDYSIDDDLTFTAKGTGRTTGHIATISVQNNSDQLVTIRPQIFYIPSDGRYQSYVGRIRDPVTIAPGTTVDIPVQGYCADVHTKPVPEGTPTEPIENWVPVGHIESPDPDNPWPAGSVNILPREPVAAFDPSAVPDIVGSSGYTPSSEPEPDILATWPGTGNPIGGIFNPGVEPKSFARVIVEALARIEGAAETIISTGSFPTPFSNNPERERESIIQQTFWIFCAVVTGQEYQKSDFADNVYTQYKDNMGTAVSTLPEERRQQIDAGIDDFWDVFQATGVEAKVISIESPGLSELISDHPDLAQASPPDPDAPPAEEGPAECDCDSLTFVVSTDFGGLQKNSTKQKITEFSASKNKTHKVAIELDAEEYTEKTTVNVSGITLYCTTCRAAPCHPHAPASDGKNAKMTDDTKDKILVSGIDTEGASETPDTRETSGSSLSMTVTPDTKAANYFISFKISGTCMAPEPCKEKKCIRYIQVEVKAKKKEK